MKVLVTGSKGKLGQRLLRELTGRCEILGLDVDELDISKLAPTLDCVRAFHPQVIVNAAAFTAVDRCEDEPETAYQMNSLAVRNLAIAAEDRKARLIHFSTDFVFDGTRSGPPYHEYDEVQPLSVYGKSKLAGEREALAIASDAIVIRLAWLYGGGGWNFTDWVIESVRQRQSVQVVTDQIGTPTWVGDVSAQVRHLLEAPARGLYHGTGQGSCSRYDWACEAVRAVGLEPSQVIPVTSEVFQQKAPRPRYSVLDNLCLRTQDLDIMRPWQEALRDHLQGK
jgi:dTDP-4-dehydrorhamnose reductase